MHRGDTEGDRHEYSQEELLRAAWPLLQAARVYGKRSKVSARQLEREERIVTVTADGPETANVARVGDFVVRNDTTAGERYVMTPEAFAARYRLLERSHDGWDRYESSGRVRAFRWTPGRARRLGLPLRGFRFRAAWGGLMTLRPGDYLAAPLDGSEVYRVAGKEFRETYRPHRLA
jgi:hypothetical protein